MRENSPSIRVLMVCLGNICRSPTAHGVMQKQIENNQLMECIEVDSAGTGDWHCGERPDPRTLAAAALRGYALDSLRARQVVASDFESFDYIFAMDQMNLAELRAQCPPQHLSKLQLLLDHANSDLEAVPDPYYSGEAGFELVLDLVEEACERVLQHLCVRHQLSGPGSGSGSGSFQS
jgi:protein-tyrosine phosphatase